MVEAGGIEPPSETESPQRLRACSAFKSRASDCRRTGHPVRQRPRRISPKVPATRIPASLPVVASTPSRRQGFRVAAVFRPREPVQCWRLRFPGNVNEKPWILGTRLRPQRSRRNHVAPSAATDAAWLARILPHPAEASIPFPNSPPHSIMPVPQRAAEKKSENTPLRSPPGGCSISPVPRP